VVCGRDLAHRLVSTPPRQQVQHRFLGKRPENPTILDYSVCTGIGTTEIYAGYGP
jgi:hypothetical protein